MHLYTYVSIAVVVLTTFVLYQIFRRNDLKDYRYHLGLGISAVIAVIASLFLPKMISVISVDWALQFALAFFIAFLIYITILFLVMMIVSSIFPKEKVDKLLEKWEQKRITKQSAKEQKQKEKAGQSEDNANSPDPHSEEPVLKNIFIDKFSSKKKNEASEGKIEIRPQMDQAHTEEQERLEEDTIQSSTTLDEPLQTIEENKEQQTDGTQISRDSNAQESPNELIISNMEDENKEIQLEEWENKPVEESISPKTGEIGFSEKDNSGRAGIFDKTENSSEISAEKEEFREKNVDTPDIIDKMGIETISNTSVSFSDPLNVDQLIDRAFLLKQEGRDLEAASLFMNALDMKPDTEVVFWIVLDICVIYKNSGQTELAEEILQIYLNEYKDLMSNEVKEQILQSLNS